MTAFMGNRTSVVTLLLILASCGGGGGSSSGSGDSGTPAQGPGDVENFFPHDLGNSWFYTGLTSAGGNPDGSFFNVISTDRELTIGGSPATAFEESQPYLEAPSNIDYFSKDSNAVTYQGSDPSDIFTASVVPYRTAIFPLAAGQVSVASRRGIQMGTDLDGDGISERLDFDLAVRMVNFEPLVTGAGTIARTARFVTTYDGTIRGSGGGSAIQSITETSWYAPGIGLVKRITQTRDDTSTYEDRMELRGFDIGGVRRGMGNPLQVTTGLGPSNSDTDRPGRPALASDGHNFLMITNRRTGVEITTPIIKYEGHLLDDQGIELRSFDISVAGHDTSPHADVDVAFGNGIYIAVFVDRDDSTHEPSLYLQRITANGEILDGPAGRLLATDWPGSVAVAAGNDVFLVVFTRPTRFNNGGSEEHLYGVLVSAAGVVQGSGEFPIAARAGNQSSPSVAFDGSNFLVVWQDTIAGNVVYDAFNIAATRVTPAGVVLDPQFIEISSAPLEQSRPDVAFGAGQYLVVWQDARDSVPFKEFDIRAARVTPAGALLDGPADSGSIVINAEPGIAKHRPALAFAGGQFLTSWTTSAPLSLDGTNSGIYLARINADGSLTTAPASGSAVSGVPPRRTVSRFDWPNVVAGDGSSLVAWMGTGENPATAGPSSKAIYGAIAYAAP